MDLFERNSLHLELPELVRSREDGAEEDGMCPEKRVGKGAQAPPAARAVVAEAHPSIRYLCRGVSLPLIHTGGGARCQGSVPSKAPVKQIL